MMGALPVFHRLTMGMVGAGLCWLTTRQLALFLSVAGPDRLAGEISVRSLSRQLLVSKPVITRALHSLEKARLVRRVAHPEDARMVLIEPGADADELLAKLETVLAGELAR